MNTTASHVYSSSPVIVAIDLTFFNASNASSIEAASGTSHLTPVWMFVPVFLVITSILGLIGNAMLVVIFLCERTIRHRFSDFNIHMVSLLIANILCIIVNYPMEVVTSVYSSVWFMGYPACTLLIYGWDILEAICMNSHALIAVVRVWAIVHPISYRNFHSKSFALIACAGVWVWVHIFMLPGIFLDTLYYRAPVEVYGCLLNSAAQREWSIANLFVVYFVPWVVVLLALPAVIFAHVFRQWQSYFSGSLKVAPEEPARSPRNVTAVATMEHTGGVDVQKKQKPALKKYVLLIALTMSVTVCWSPSLVYFIIVDFGGQLWIPNFYEVARVLFSFQPMLDPLMFALSFTWIQDFFRCFRRKQRRQRLR